jgi:saccharopine dehydrogenase-like NADP-dependent oxidoreductase
MSRQLVVVGAAGAQAASMQASIFRAISPADVTAIDVSWPADRSKALSSKGAEVRTIDGTGKALADAIRGSQTVVNLAGPYHRLGTLVLDATIRAGANYLDICDDVDVTRQILERHGEAVEAGVTAITGLGSSPGMTNVLVRVAVEYLGEPAETTADISWVVDHSDLSTAVVEHLLHCFATIHGREPGPVPGWDELEPRWVNFPEPVGHELVVLLGHPEPLTLTRFLGLKTVTNRGGIAPVEYTQLCWLLARARQFVADDETETLGKGFDWFDSAFAKRLVRQGSGLVIQVRRGERTVQFRSGSSMTMDHATGVPAAAGSLLLLEGRVPGPGVFSPECLEPASFFDALRKVSPGGGGLSATVFDAGEQPVPIRIRDLLNQAGVQ